MTRSLALLVLWVALWGEISVANVVSGVIVIGCVTWLFDHGRSRRYAVKPIAAMRLAGHVLASLVGSSVRVAIAVFSSDPRRVGTSIQTVRLRGDSLLVGAIVANSITMTPGTMSLDLNAEEMTIRVHILGEVDPVAFENEILHLESLVARAFVVRSR